MSRVAARARVDMMAVAGDDGMATMRIGCELSTEPAEVDELEVDETGAMEAEPADFCELPISVSSSSVETRGARYLDGDEVADWVREWVGRREEARERVRVRERARARVAAWEAVMTWPGPTSAPNQPPSSGATSSRTEPVAMSWMASPTKWPVLPMEETADDESLPELLAEASEAAAKTSVDSCGARGMAERAADSEAGRTTGSESETECRPASLRSLAMSSGRRSETPRPPEDVDEDDDEAAWLSVESRRERATREMAIMSSLVRIIMWSVALRSSDGLRLAEVASTAVTGADTLLLISDECGESPASSITARRMASLLDSLERVLARGRQGGDDESRSESESEPEAARRERLVPNSPDGEVLLAPETSGVEGKDAGVLRARGDREFEFKPTGPSTDDALASVGSTTTARPGDDESGESDVCE